ncbi:MAG: transposase [Gammaproteobacteria bacterium]|nr:MAG: transposase [Gammaproteobacteria bacterium]
MAENGHPVNRKTMAKSLRRQGLRARASRRFKATTQSKHSLPVCPNLLAQNFEATAPNQKWVSDITYLWTDEGWLYLAVVMDLFSRRIVGRSMSEHLKVDLVCGALKMALWRRGMPERVIVHSGRGSQYCSGSHQNRIRAHDLRRSMSSKGNCYDNACAESFFHSLKVEAIHGERIRTRDQTRRVVSEYIEVDYDQDRRHSANGSLSPARYEALQAAQSSVRCWWVGSPCYPRRSPPGRLSWAGYFQRPVKSPGPLQPKPIPCCRSGCSIIALRPPDRNDQ